MKKTEEKVQAPNREKTNKPNPTPSRTENQGQIQKNPVTGPTKNVPPQEWQSGKPSERQEPEGKRDTDSPDVEVEEDESGLS
jgi:hypothetical protein